MRSGVSQRLSGTNTGNIRRTLLGAVCQPLAPAVMLAVAAASPALGAAYYWDTNGTATGSGNAGGNWTDSNWTLRSAGANAANPVTTWVAGSDATFSAGSDGTGTFTVALVNDNISVRNIAVEEGNVTLGTSGSLKLSAAATWKASDGTTLTVQRGIDNNGFALTFGSVTAGGGDIAVSGVIQGNGTLVKTGEGTLTLSAANLYTGATSVGLSGNVGGTLRLSGSGKISNAALSVTSGTLDLNGTTQEVTSVTMGGLTSGTGPRAEITIGSGELKIGATLTLSNGNANGGVISGDGGGRLSLMGNRTFQIGDVAGLSEDLVVSAIIQDGDSTSRNLTKGGIGVLTLSGANTYTGTTGVSAGTLMVTGSLASSQVTVASSGTLGGTGTMGAVQVSSGGTLAPGKGGVGILHTGNLTAFSGATYTVDITGSAAVAGTNYDQSDVTGTVNLGGSTLSVLLGNYTATNGQLFFIVKNDGNDAVSGTFNGLAQGSEFAIGDNRFQISYIGDAGGVGGGTFTGGNDVVLMAVVPEPGTALAAGSLSLLALLRRRRRRG